MRYMPRIPNHTTAADNQQKSTLRWMCVYHAHALLVDAAKTVLYADRLSDLTAQLAMRL
jgi:hypothetical protein